MGFWNKEPAETPGRPGPPPRVLLAAATMVTQSSFRRLPNAQDWQTQLWAYYDVVPEFRFCVDWKAQAASRAYLYVGETNSDGTGDPIPTENLRARLPLEELGGQAEIAELVSRCITQLGVPGETYLVGVDVEDNGTTTRRWLFASGDEFQRDGSKMTVQLPETGEPVELDPETSAVIRIWRRHPRIAWQANSPSRAVLPILKEIIDLSAHITASAESRLAGAGVFEISEDSVLPPSDVEEDQEPLHEDPSMATMIDAMVTPIGDRDSASAVVPIIMRSPPAAMGKARHITFSTPLDKEVSPLRDAAIRRLGLGMDVPPEVLLGLGASNHWNADQISIDRIVIHVAPDLTMMCQALTAEFLRPALTALGVDDVERYVIWFDLAELTQKPDRSQVALDLWREGLISDEAALRECGFPDDRPVEAEATRRLLVKLALAGVDPAVIAPYMEILARGAIQAVPALPAPPPAPAPPPVEPPALAAALVLDVESSTGDAEPGYLTRQEWQIRTVELGVMYALERVGRRILGDPGGRSLRGREDLGPVWSIHASAAVKAFDPARALEGAYAVLDVVLADQPRVRSAVVEYVAALLEAREAHQRGYLVAVLKRAGCLDNDQVVVPDAA